MFDLSPEDLSGKIIDCAAGPSSFNAESHELGHDIVSCDPIYRFTAEEIQTRIEATYDTMISNARAAHHEFGWREIRSPQHLGEIRMAAMQCFLADFPRGLDEGRYIEDELPSLGFFDSGQFDVVLCSHFLFTYSEQLSIDFHVASVQEMCRVASARIFPSLKSYGGPSPKLEPVIEELRDSGYRVETRKVPYEIQRGGDEMLLVMR